MHHVTRLKVFKKRPRVVVVEVDAPGGRHTHLVGVESYAVVAPIGSEVGGVRHGGVKRFRPFVFYLPGDNLYASGRVLSGCATGRRDGSVHRVSLAILEPCDSLSEVYARGGFRNAGGLLGLRFDSFFLYLGRGICVGKWLYDGVGGQCCNGGCRSKKNWCGHGHKYRPAC